MKRASKRLVMSIIALVASVILCIGMCLAWFAMNKDVSGNGMQTQVKGSDIVSFEVVASYLDFYDSDKTDYKTADDGNVSTLEKTFDKNNNGTFNISSDNGSTSNDEMRSFDSTKMYSSAVLFKVDYEILAGCEKSFRIYATCPYTTEHMTENVFTVIKSTAEGETDTYYSSVSNAVFLSEAGYDDTNDKYTVKSSSETEAYNVKFIKEDYSKYFTRYLKTGIESTSSDANTKGTLYYLMDYDEDLFNVLTNAMLTSGGTLNSKIVLDGDVVFGIEEYDTEATTPSVESVTFVNSTSVTTQAAGSDVMTSSWQFLLDYSDDTLETVKYNASEFTVDESFSTSSTGSKTVTIKYGELTVQYQPAEGEATTSIPYTITEATAVTGITLNRYTLSLIYDSETPATAQLTATIAPSGATNKTVIWTTSDSDVATVSSTGLVTATGAGTATITAKSDANNEITNSCTVTVTASSSATAVTGVTLDSKTLALYVNSSIADADKATLTATITPEGATNKDVTWTSSDPTVATVDTSGNVTALSIGNTNITVTTSDGGYTAVCSVMVYDASTLVSVTSVSLDKTTLSLTVGDSDKLTASITPSNATITSVSWSSSDDTVATVSSTGVVTAKKAGTATITVTTLDGGKTATCAVNVSAAASTEEYTVTFNMNGHGTEIASVETVDGKISAPTEPTAVGYTFGGWYTDAACSGTAIDFDSYTFVENTTIYAKWTVMDYTTGTHTLTFSADADIFTSNVVNSGNGYNKTYFKVANNDYLYAIMRLQSGSVIKVTGKAQPSNKSVNESDASKNTTTLGISLSSDSSGAVGSDLPKSYTFTVQNYIDNGNSALSFAFECTVTTEGIIVFAFTRDSGGTGCEITELVIEIDPASAATTPSSIAYASGTTTFKKGITASTSDWSFTVTYSDSTSKTVTASNVSIGTIDTSADGSVSVSYTENGTTVYTTVNYTVQAPTAIAFKSGTQTFAQNVVASTSDWKFTVTYGSLGTEEVDVSAVTVGTIDTTTTGENKSVTVTLTGTELTCTVTYAVTAAATCVADGIYTFSSEYSTTNKNAGFTISGTYTSSANVTYNGTTYNDGLKMESSTSVKFTLGSAKTVRFVVGPEGNKIKIDGTSYTIDSGNTITIENLTAGEHEITKDSSSTYLVLIIIGYEAVPVSSVTISGDNVVVAGRSITLTATVLPINAENKTVTWAIKSGSEYAEINSSTGVLTGKAQGDVVVTATAGGVTSADFGVTVNAAELDKLEYTGTTSYTVSSEAVTPDWVFTATYSDGTTKTVTPTLTGDISDGTISIATAGDYTVTASYTDENETIVTCTVNYKVIEESSGTINDSFYAKDASGYSSGKALNLTSTNKYFTITSTNNYKLAVVTNVDSDSCLVATSNKRNFTVTCGSTATKIVITLKLAFATGAKFETISTATITGTTETFEITNIVDEYTFTITQGNSITITATDYIAFVSAIAAVTPAS